MYSLLKRIFVGRPLSSAEQEHQRLIKTGRQACAPPADVTARRDG